MGLDPATLNFAALPPNPAILPSNCSASVTEHCVSTTNLGPVTPNFAEDPRNQPLYHRTIHTTSPSYQQVCPTESQTDHHNALPTIDHPTTVSNQSPHIQGWTMEDKVRQALTMEEWKRDIRCCFDVVRTSVILDWARHTRLDDGGQS